MVGLSRDDVWMVDIDLSGGLGAGPRRRRSAVERRPVVEETLEGGCFSGSGGGEAWCQRESGLPVAALVSGWQAGSSARRRDEVAAGQRS